MAVLRVDPKTATHVGLAKLRVLFLISRDITHPALTGGDQVLWEVAHYLAERGHEVTVMASGFAGAPKTEIIEGIKVVRSGGLLAQWWSTFIFYMTKARGKYDVVVVEGFGGSRIPRFTPLYVGEPIVTEWHQIHADLFAVQYPKILGPALNFLERATAFVHRNTIVMARTEDWRRLFPTIGFKPENIRVVPVSIPEEWLELTNEPRVTEPRILWLGKFRRYKCPDHAIRALPQVLRTVPNAVLTLAGRHDDMVYESELAALARSLGVEEHVHFEFNVTEHRKRELFDSARMLVVTSTVEGFGIVVLEANARGVPVVASTGVPEGAVRNQVNGVRYRFGDSNELALSIVQIATDDALYASLSGGGRQFASEFGWRQVCQRYEDVLREVIALK